MTELPVEMSIQPERKPFKCTNCHAELGTTDGMRLYNGNAIFPLKVTIICAQCSASRVWRPVVVIMGDKTVAR